MAVETPGRRKEVSEFFLQPRRTGVGVPVPAHPYLRVPVSLSTVFFAALSWACSLEACVPGVWSALDCGAASPGGVWGVMGLLTVGSSFLWDWRDLASCEAGILVEE